MNRVIEVLGKVALLVICLWAGVALLEVIFDFADDLFEWFRYDILPGVFWAFVIGAVLYILFGWFRRIDRSL
jgi:peptidoglycan/LPS O-acetylase OafA/YrhL